MRVRVMPTNGFVGITRFMRFAFAQDRRLSQVAITYAATRRIDQRGCPEYCAEFLQAWNRYRLERIILALNIPTPLTDTENQFSGTTKVPIGLCPFHRLEIRRGKRKTQRICWVSMATTARLELVTSAVTGRRSNQLSYAAIVC